MSANFQQSRANFREKLQDIPHKPGVYIMRDRIGRIIYVGKAKDLRKRLSNYFTPSRGSRADIKTRALVDSIWDFEINTVRSENEALLLEGKLIKDYRPKYNVVFRDDKRFLMLKINLSDPLPKFQLVRVQKMDGAKYYGPFPHSGALRFTYDWLNKNFGLRTCRSKNPGEVQYKHCNDDIIRNCSAPCIQKVDNDQYLEQVNKACDFLEGGWKERVSELESQMQEASDNNDFETAANCRDMIHSLRKTLQPSRKFTRGRGVPSPNIDPESDINELKEYLGMDSIPKVMECFDISNISSSHIVASMVRFENGLPDNSGYRRYRIKGVKKQNDFSSMAEVVRRRYSRILLSAKNVAEDMNEYSQESVLDAVRRIGNQSAFVRLPDLVVVDGGKGQLSSALKELRKLGLHDLPIIGLAKKNEEVFMPDNPNPLRIPHDTGALKLLQRIRDEAHRYANSYHQLLMRRRIEESVLDDCPGITENRKKILLKRFGSVSRLKRAEVEKIAEIQGISSKSAKQIKDFLN
ncbi:MAG: excinuclease ABC subunit UvrC [Verrucomicrobiota bacterium]|nr:excinuclease ABC subunit UvrC [Verrucomicrobiota bacterium]